MLPDLAAGLIANVLASFAATALERRDTPALSRVIAGAWNRTVAVHGDQAATLLDPEFIAGEGGPEVARVFLSGPGPDANKLAQAYVKSVGVPAGLERERAQEFVPTFKTFLDELTERLAADPRFRTRVEEAAKTRQWETAPLSGLRVPPPDLSASEWQQVAHQTEAELAGRVASLFSPADVGTEKGGPDLVVTRPEGIPPLAIELKVWRASAKNLGNRVAEALSSAVLLRREFSGGVQLGLLVVFFPGTEFPVLAEVPSISRRLARLVRRSADDAGFDRVIVGAWQADGQWHEVDADGVLHPIAEFSEAVAQFASPSRVPVARRKRDSVDEPFYQTQAESREEPRPRILLFASGWGSRFGGISTFNREFAIALVDSGCEVHVVIPEADHVERDAATDHGVTLVTPDPIPGVTGQQLLLTRPRFTDPDYYPTVIVGHGRVLGPYAYAAQNLWYPDAKRVHIVHMDAERLEFVKDARPGRSAVLTADARRALEVELSISADLVTGVGPSLTEMIRDAMRGFRQEPPRVLELRPGLRDWGSVVDPRDPPARRQVLLVARAEDVLAKGIDIAARAVALAVSRFDHDSHDSPTLVVRGVPANEADSIKDRLDSIVAPETTVIARPFSTDEESLRRDLWQSRVVVMPSREEGFGLVAFEAIAAGVPVLVSRDSGVGRILREVSVDGERPAPREVISVRETEENITRLWADAIYDCLVDPLAAFRRAAQLREQVASEMTWAVASAQLLDALGLSHPHRE
jgi:D-inositol-3-phosphate glycosyltransferase